MIQLLRAAELLRQPQPVAAGAVHRTAPKESATLGLAVLKGMPDKTAKAIDELPPELQSVAVMFARAVYDEDSDQDATPNHE